MIGLSDVIVVVDGDDIMITSVAGVQKVGKLDGAVRPARSQPFAATSGA